MRQRAFVWRLLLAAVMCCAGSVRAATGAEPAPDISDLGVEQLLNLQVSAVSKFSQPLNEAPASVTVITAADIATFGYRTLTDILNAVPGLYVANDRSYDYLGVRGFSRSGDYNGRVLVVIDGFRVNDPVYASGTIGTEALLDVDLIDRVEFVPGPGSSMYGSNAFLGVVNVITRKGRHFRGWSVNLEGATDDTYKERVTFGDRFGNGLDLVASATHYGSDGPDRRYPGIAPGADDVARGMDRERFDDFLFSAGWRGWSFEAAYEKRLQREPTTQYHCVFADPRCTIEDIQHLVQLRYDAVVADDVDLQARVFDGRYDYIGNYPYDAGDGSVIVNRDGSQARWWGGEFKAVASPWKGHQVVAGAEYTRNQRIRQFNYDPEPYAFYADERHRDDAVGLYAQDEIRLGTRLLLSVGLRGDRVGDYGDAWSPRAALNVSLDSATTAKIAYGTAFRAPGGFEGYFVDIDGYQKSNHDLDPETTSSVDLTLERAVEGRYRCSLSAFRSHIDDLISQVIDPSDGLLVYRNISSAKSTGAEIGCELLWHRGIHARTSYAWQRVVDEETGDWLENSPRHIAKLAVSAPMHVLSIGAALELLYTGARRTGEAELGGYTLANLTLRRERLLPGLALSFSAYNLFDRDYRLVGTEALAEAGLASIAGDGRTYRLKAEYAF